MRHLATTIGLVLLWLAEGCAMQSVGAVEACVSEVGLDGKPWVDCANPSCQALEACRSLPVQVSTNPPGPTPPTPPPNVDPPPNATPDADVPVPVIDAGSDSPADEGKKPNKDDCKGAGCDAGPVCGDMGCDGPVASQLLHLKVTQIDLSVPRSVDGATCVDSDVECHELSVSPLYWFCTCAPDTVVEMLVDDEVVAETSPPVVGDEVRWKDPIALAFPHGAKLSLRAMDQDHNGRKKIFDCDFNVDDVELASGVVTCTKAFMANGLSVDYSLTLTVEVVGG
jgi:hypothetical protein